MGCAFTTIGRKEAEFLGKEYEGIRARRIVVVRVFYKNRAYELWEVYCLDPQGNGRRGKRHPGISGKIEGKESAREAAERELQEELGLKLKIPSQLGRERWEVSENNVPYSVTEFDLDLPSNRYCPYYISQLPKGRTIRFDWYPTLRSSR